jgi:hypothetical protein
VIRARQADRFGLDEAERVAAGGRAGPGSPGLDHLLDAVRAPATAEELRGERAMIAAMAAERRRVTAAPAQRVPAVPAPRPVRRLAVTVVAAVALLGASGTAVAARTGDLPAGVQQSAHRLFSGLGVPPPTTRPTREPEPTRSSARPTRTPSPSAGGKPGAATPAQWCAAWRTAAGGGHPMNGRDRRDLIEAAGGEDDVARYCATVTASPSTAEKKKDLKSKKPKNSKEPKK